MLPAFWGRMNSIKSLQFGWLLFAGVLPLTLGASSVRAASPPVRFLDPKDVLEVDVSALRFVGEECAAKELWNCRASLEMKIDFIALNPTIYVSTGGSVGQFRSPLRFDPITRAIVNGPVKFSISGAEINAIVQGYFEYIREKLARGPNDSIRWTAASSFAGNASIYPTGESSGKGDTLEEFVRVLPSGTQFKDLSYDPSGLTITIEVVRNVKILPELSPALTPEARRGELPEQVGSLLQNASELRNEYIAELKGGQRGLKIFFDSGLKRSIRGPVGISLNGKPLGHVREDAEDESP
jgi:hypothetical protein